MSHTTQDGEIIFENDGTAFSAFHAARKWCRERGISMGSMQASSPIGLAFGDCGISKWRNMTAADREELDGRIEWLNGGPRDGNARVTIYRHPEDERP